MGIRVGGVCGVKFGDVVSGCFLQEARGGLFSRCGGVDFFEKISTRHRQNSLYSQGAALVFSRNLRNMNKSDNFIGQVG